MARQLSEREAQDFLAEPHIAVLSVAGDDDRPPLTFPTWYGYQRGGQITYYTHRPAKKTRKLRLLREGGVLALCAQREEMPYKYVTVEGTVVSISNQPTGEQMLSIVRRYLPEADAQAYVTGDIENPDVNLVLFTIRPDRWTGTDFAEDAH
ncbi:MAG: pyridoxamine 5'-phosphate oxidase family protein [Chloroflexota bacterium]|nr:pyridoxamine 5'-phosphate oxidase family protein [Chloroflexota bacterium]